MRSLFLLLSMWDYRRLTCRSELRKCCARMVKNIVVIEGVGLNELSITWIISFLKHGFMIVVVKFWNRATEGRSVQPRRHQPSVGLWLGQVLKRLSFAAHTIVAHCSRDIDAALAEVKV